MNTLLGELSGSIFWVASKSLSCNDYCQNALQSVLAKHYVTDQLLRAKSEQILPLAPI